MQSALENSAAFIESVIAAWCQCIDSNLYALFVFLYPDCDTNQWCLKLEVIRNIVINNGLGVFVCYEVMPWTWMVTF